MADESTTLTVLQDDTGYQYDLAVLPAADAPLIQEASTEILQEMQVENIIQNLENVARLMFVAYNALSGTMVQSKMSGLQKKYLDLMDESGQAITTFRHKSEEICALVAKAYGWLLKGKEKMALIQFNKCAQDASAMAERAEKLAMGFQSLSDQAENVLESTQDEQALQYQKMDELKAQMDQYNANLKKCESLRDSLKEDIDSINKVYNDAKKKEQQAFDMKRGLMITQIVTSCIGAIIPSVASIKSGSGSSETSKAAQDAQKNLDQEQKQKDDLTAKQKSAQEKLNGLKNQEDALQKEIEEIQQKIEVEKASAAKEEAERNANLKQYEKQLSEKQKELDQVKQQISQVSGQMGKTSADLQKVTSSIDNLNKQLSAYAEQCRDDLQRAEEAADKALEKKLELEKQRRETLASIQEFTVLIESSVERKNVAETAVQTLQVAIRCIKQVVVALVTAAKFWRSMEEYCKTLSDASLGQQIAELSEGLTAEERQEYYRDRDFMMAFLTYVCRWAALYYVCDDYRKRSLKVRGMVEENIQASYTREEEWNLAGKLAKEMGDNIQAQVDASRRVTEALTA